MKYWWNGKLRTVKEIADIEGVGYMSAYKYVDKGYSSSNEVNHRRTKPVNSVKLETPNYDSFIDEMLSWDKD